MLLSSRLPREIDYTSRVALFSHVPFEHMTARDVLARLGLLCGNGTLTNAAVQADIFWDRVDVYSPGGFPAGVSPEAYLSGEADASRPRNPLIVRALYRSGDIEACATPACGASRPPATRRARPSRSSGAQAAST